MRFPPPAQGRDPRDRETPHISISQAAMVERCPLAWRFKYVEAAAPDPREDGANLRIGIALDRACEQWYRDEDQVGQSRYTRAFEHIRALAGDAVYRRAHDAWSAFLAHPCSAWRAAPNGVQRRHVYELPALPPWGTDDLAVIGYSDLVTDDGVVVDFKYGGRPNDEQWMRGVIRQLAFYRLADDELPACGPAVIVRFGGRTQPEVIPVTVGEGDVADLLRWLDAARAGGPDAVYHPAQPGGHCGWCSYQTACRARQVALAALDRSGER